MLTVVEKSVLAKPFLKWAGGKGQLINDIEERLPVEIRNGGVDTYIEPFVGGGAVFFYIAQKYESIKHFYVFDINQDLVNCYLAVRDDIDLLIRNLRSLKDKFFSLKPDERKEFYLKIRKKFNKEKKLSFETKTAAKLIFLNKTCFNGLYRVNKKGEFNVPVGSYKKPNICDESTLRSASDILQKTEIICGDFEKSYPFIDKHGFVYFDPPYRPLSSTASFTSYCKERFSEPEQIRLARFCKKVHKKGAKFLLSNSDPKNENPNDSFFGNNYSEFAINKVKATRMINCNATGRGQINELLITNY